MNQKKRMLHIALADNDAHTLAIAEACADRLNVQHCPTEKGRWFCGYTAQLHELIDRFDGKLVFEWTTNEAGAGQSNPPSSSMSSVITASSS